MVIANCDVNCNFINAPQSLVKQAKAVFTKKKKGETMDGVAYTQRGLKCLPAFYAGFK